MQEQSDVVVTEGTSLKRAMEAINNTGLGIVFVVDKNGQIVGSVTDGDIRRSLLDGNGVSQPVQEVANTDPVVAYESWDDRRFATEIDESLVRQYIEEPRVLTVPVLDGDDRIVSITHVNANGERVDTKKIPTPVDTVLIIGGAGYLGSQLCRELLSRGYTVRVLDTLLFGTVGIEDLLEADDFHLIEGDMRSIDVVVEGLRCADAVIHLGGLVGDPASAIDPAETLELNYHATKMIANVCKYHQINRFIFASTCSVYGESPQPEDLLTETSELNPVSLYARTKIKSEQALRDLEDETFSPTIFRMATLYGYSPRMRFDLVVNILTAKAHHENVVPIFGGDQYRPNLHVRDAARAYVDCLETPIETVGGEVFNVGSNAQNYKIADVGEIVASCFPDADIDWQREKEDERSYQVDFSKISRLLDYDVEETIEGTVRNLKERFELGEFDDYTDEKYSNYRTIEQESD
jgi:nucleoside-diphosphate-sugar epimerase